MRSAIRFIIPGLFAVILVTAMTAVAAGNTVPTTRVEDRPISFQLNHLRPGACSGLILATLVTGSGTLSGTSGNDLILGSSNVDSTVDLGGDDCILGGGGDDVITGGPGNDVCLGGPGNDIFLTCETQIQ